jgi:type IV pilus assembly protein PilY1
MKPSHVVPIKCLLACGLAAALAAQPAFAQVAVSQLPLASAGGSTVLPNLLFTLDNSGSMDWDFVPDYVDPGTPGTNQPNNPCMTNSGNSTLCVAGDPPYSAGGQFAMNGVAYDPNFSYLAGVDSNGLPHFNPPTGTIAVASTPNDAYQKQSIPTPTGTTNITSGIQDRRYCNSNNVCMRSGQTDSAAPAPSAPAGIPTLTLVSGTDDSGHAMSAGKFPYRTNKSNSSFGVVAGVQTNVFGLPEMMQIGSFKRASATVTATTVEAHGLTTSDKVYVTSGTAGLNVTCVAVATVANANTFTYTSGSSGTINATNATYRKCVNLGSITSFVRLLGSNTVTVASPGHGLVTNDIITSVTSVSNMNATSTATGTVTVVDANTFKYTSSATSLQSLPGSWVRTGLYNVVSNVNGPAVAYHIVPVEFCADVNLTDCVEAIPPAVAPANYTFPAYVRFCRTQEEALAHGAVTFIATVPQTNRCQLKYLNVPGLQFYQFPRYGHFVRETIISGPTYGNRPNRVDCLGVPTCTYTEEIQNYAKWYAYYRTRLQMMKTAVGISFRSFISNPAGTPPKPDILRVGFITIHAQDTGSVVAAQYLRFDSFNTTQANNFYTKFYQQTPGSATPLREALSRAGWIYAGKLNNTGLTKGIPAADDPVQSSCQKNYTLLTTDGFWNGNAGQDIAGTAMGNWDNADPYNYTAANMPAGVTPAYTDPIASRATGTYDGNIVPGTVAGSNPGTKGTLADVALYYYMTDLRDGKDFNGNTTGSKNSPSSTPANTVDVGKNNVQPQGADFAQHQHMVTFTLGLAEGMMRYQADYETATTGDFANIKSAAPSACFWAAGVCNWPAPQENQQAALDDLWHAAVNGRGTFFQATNPRTLATALQAAIGKVAGRTASASAAATSSPNITPKDNFAFSTTYQTQTWSGIVQALQLDATTGAPILDPATGKPKILWQADQRLLSQVSAGGDSRNIWMFDPTKATKLKSFTFANMTAAEQAFFLGKCPTMTQCSLLTGGQTNTVNNPPAPGVEHPLVGFLRGQTGNETVLFRDRIETDTVTNATIQTVLGDIVDATPAYVRLPEFNYQDAGYNTFKTANVNRPGTLYVAANDGYLHAFDNTTDAAGTPIGASTNVACPSAATLSDPASLGDPTKAVAGCELWAYMPKFVMPGIYQISDTGYANAHRFMLDGSPEIGDVFDATASAWKTIIVGGANAGARGFYALDITNPRSPQGLWEFCSTSTLCPTVGGISHSDADLGFSYGNPVMGKLSDGTWVVVLTSGLNNVSTGTGQGYFYVLDAITGKVLYKISTGTGDTINPSGLMRHAGYYKAGLINAKIEYVYGGDLQGNVWRMDMTMATATVAPTLMHMATLKDGVGNTQPITVRPVLTNLGGFRIYYVGTGRYLASTDPSDVSQQSIYGLKDKDTDYNGSGAATRTNLVAQVLSTSATKRTITTNPVDWTTQDGFVIDLNPGATTPGERIVLDPRLELGTLIFASNIPIVGGCTPGGDSFLYNFDFRTGSYVPGTLNGTAGEIQGAFLVGVTPIQTTDGSIRVVKTDSGGGLGTGETNIDKNPKGISRFSYRER